jgi:hypothetical protein
VLWDRKTCNKPEKRNPLILKRLPHCHATKKLEDVEGYSPVKLHLNKTEDWNRKLEEVDIINKTPYHTVHLC